MKKFSVIVPIYNAEKYLKICLDSIVMQTYHDYEVLLIDDGSTDDSGNICDSFAARFKQIRVIHKNNAGVSAARNTGIELADAEYLVFVDSDDFLAETYLSSIHNIIDKKKPDIIVNSGYYIYSKGKCESDVYGIRDLDGIAVNDMVNLLLERKYPSALWMSIYRSALLKEHKLDEAIHFYEDLDFQLSLVDDVKFIAVNNSVGYYYRDGSVTHSRFSEKTISCYRIIEKLYKRKVPECKIDILEAEFVISNALIAAKDKTDHSKLDMTLKQRARRLKKSVYVKKRQDLYRWIKIIACSPRLFYMLFRIKHR